MQGTVSLSLPQVETIHDLATEQIEGEVVTVVIHPNDVANGVRVCFHRAHRDSVIHHINRAGTVLGKVE